MANELTHFDAAGNAHMVDVSEKKETERIARASGRILVSPAVYETIAGGTAKKGDVLGVARIAGIMAAKKTSDAIPLCHPLPLTRVSIDFELLAEASAVEARAEVKTRGVTGVEMEALHAVSIALLTIYDMCKAVDRGMVMEGVRLLEKRGGKSDWHSN